VNDAKEHRHLIEYDKDGWQVRAASTRKGRQLRATGLTAPRCRSDAVDLLFV
jgi:hypothetical protein